MVLENESGGHLFHAPMSIVDIKKCIPHRYPFLLLDRINDYMVGEFIHAQKNVTGNEPLLQGHFPGNPIVPGVMIVECMAQASAVLGKLTRPDTAETCLLIEIDKTRFRKQIVPGDCMAIFVKVIRRRRDFFWFEGEVKVANQLAATATFSAKLA